MFLTKFIIFSVYNSTRNIYPPKNIRNEQQSHRKIKIKNSSHQREFVVFGKQSLSSIFHQVQKVVQCKRGLKNPLEARLEDTMTRFHGSIPIREIRDSFLSRNSRGSGLELVLVGGSGSLGLRKPHGDVCTMI